MTKKKPKVVLPVGTIELKTELFHMDKIDEIKNDFKFVMRYPLSEQLVRCYEIYKTLENCDMAQLNATNFKYILNKIRKGANRYIEKVTPFFLDPDLFEKKLHVFRKETQRFFEILNLIQSEIAVRIADKDSIGKLPEGWPERRLKLKNIVESLLQMADGISLKVKSKLDRSLALSLWNKKELNTVLNIAGELVYRAEEAIKKVKQNKRGRPVVLSINNFLLELVKIYEEGTNIKVTLGKNSALADNSNDQLKGYNGTFISFLEVCCGLFGINKLRFDLGQRAHRVLRRRKSSMSSCTSQ